MLESTWKDGEDSEKGGKKLNKKLAVTGWGVTMEEIRPRKGRSMG